MQIQIRTFHLSKTSWAQEIVEQYVKKIAPFDKIQFKVIKDEKDWLKGIVDSDRVWSCDERGESLTSKTFSKKIAALRDGGVKRLFFLVGGPFGLPEEVKKRANLTLTLSPFVMNQEVALAVLMEQIFRAYTIIHNHPYNNE